MASRAVAVMSELPPEVVTAITGGQANIVSTLDPDGRPSTTLMTWAIAKDAKRMALCVDTRSRAYLNIVERSAIAIEILADDITFGVKGTAQIAKERMDAPPFPCAIVIVDLDEVRDHGHPGTFFRGPTYHFHEDKAHRADFEQKVIDELRAFPLE